jgi:hypothetical protein
MSLVAYVVEDGFVGHHLEDRPLVLQRLYMEEFVAPAAYVAEDGLVGHQWKERPLGLANFICPSTREHQGQEVGVGG